MTTHGGPHPMHVRAARASAARASASELRRVMRDLSFQADGWDRLSGSEAEGRQPDRDPAGEKEGAAERGDGAEGADPGERHQVQAAGEEHDPAKEEPACRGAA